MVRPCAGELHPLEPGGLVQPPCLGPEGEQYIRLRENGIQFIILDLFPTALALRPWGRGFIMHRREGSERQNARVYCRYLPDVFKRKGEVYEHAEAARYARACILFSRLVVWVVLGRCHHWLADLSRSIPEKCENHSALIKHKSGRCSF